MRSLAVEGETKQAYLDGPANPAMWTAVPANNCIADPATVDPVTNCTGGPWTVDCEKNCSACCRKGCWVCCRDS